MEQAPPAVAQQPYPQLPYPQQAYPQQQNQVPQNQDHIAALVKTFLRIRKIHIASCVLAIIVLSISAAIVHKIPPSLPTGVAAYNLTVVSSIDLLVAVPGYTANLGTPSLGNLPSVLIQSHGILVREAAAG